VELFDTLAPLEIVARARAAVWDDPDWMVKLTDRFAGFIGAEPDDDHTARDGTPRDPVERLLKRLRLAGFLPEGAGREQASDLLRVVKAQYASVYRPQTRRRIALRLFKALDGVVDETTDEMRSLLEDETLGWSGLLGWPVEVTRVPGDHFTMLKEPHVASLAQAMLPCLLGAASANLAAAEPRREKAPGPEMRPEN
jgi:hypothetical protein